jgi:lipopolysaccharide transport system ATP-binding protein
MSDIAIKVEDVGKLYRLGEVGTGTLSQDLKRWWAINRGKEDPFAKIGEVNDRTQKGDSDYVWALKNISFEVKQGEVLGIIGRNGAGKSTLLKLLSKVTTPSTGSIKVKGRIASLLEVGTGFHPDLTGRENVFLNGAILGMTKAEVKKKFDEIVDFAGVERYIDTPVKRYSSGMYVRLAFAVAAFLEPEILIVDEVLAVGDAEFQKKCLGRMKDVSVNDGRTVLFVSHNIAAVSALCTQGLLLNNGRIEAQGQVDNVLKRYLQQKKLDANGRVVFNGNEPERFGEKQFARWISLQLVNSDGNITEQFVMGEKMLIQLELDVLKPSDEFEIGIGIGNLHEVYSHYFVSPWEGFTSLPKKGKTTLEVEVPRIQLFPGDYIITIWICVRGAYYDDAIHSAANFKVEEGKINEHDTYFERFSKSTQVYVPTHWSIKQ